MIAMFFLFWIVFGCGYLLGRWRRSVVESEAKGIEFSERALKNLKSRKP